MQRGGSGTFQDSNDGEIGSDADEGVSYLDRGSGLEPRQAPLSHRFMGGEVISALTGLHCKTKLHSIEADGVPTSQCKRNVVSVREALEGTASNSEGAIDNQKGKTGPKSR